MLTGRQIRDARALLGLLRSELAADIGIAGTPSLKRIEMFDGPPPVSEEYAETIRQVLERAGVEFTADGVHLKDFGLP